MGPGRAQTTLCTFESERTLRQHHVEYRGRWGRCNKDMIVFVVERGRRQLGHIAMTPVSFHAGTIIANGFSSGYTVRGNSFAGSGDKHSTCVYAAYPVDDINKKIVQPADEHVTANVIAITFKP